LPQNTTQTLLQAGLQIFQAVLQKNKIDFELQSIKEKLMGSKNFMSSSILP
jgi:hypothetical protein